MEFFEEYVVRITTHSKLRSKMQERTSIFNDLGIISLYRIAGVEDFTKLLGNSTSATKLFS